MTMRLDAFFLFTGLAFLVAGVGGLSILHTLDAGMPPLCYVDSTSICSANELLPNEVCATSCEFAEYTEDSDPENPPPYPQGYWKCDGNTSAVKTNSFSTVIGTRDGIVAGTDDRAPASKFVYCNLIYLCECDTDNINTEPTDLIDCVQEEDPDTSYGFTRVPDVPAGNVCP